MFFKNKLWMNEYYITFSLAISFYEDSELLIQNGESVGTYSG